MIASPTAAVFADAIAQTEQVKQLLTGTLDLQWTTAPVIGGGPGQTLQRLRKVKCSCCQNLGLRWEIRRVPRSNFTLFRYLVRTEARRWRRSREGACPAGVVTNSLAATDVSSVHAGYSKYRVRLLLRQALKMLLN